MGFNRKILNNGERGATRGGTHKTAVLNSPDCKPFASRTVAKREDLRRKVMLLQLTTLAEIPRSDGVVETASPQLGAVRRYVDTTGAICMSLELPVNSTARNDII